MVKPSFKEKWNFSLNIWSDTIMKSINDSEYFEAALESVGSTALWEEATVTREEYGLKVAFRGSADGDYRTDENLIKVSTLISF